MTETTESPEPEDTPAEAAEAQPERPADQSADGSAAGSAARSAVMLLGSGELSRELAWAFQRLGREVIAVGL